MRRIDKLRRLVAGKEGFDEAVARKGVADFIEGLRILCEMEGPVAIAHMLDAQEGATPRELAYLFVWREGPGCQVWADLKRFDGVDLAIDAAVEGFDTFVSTHPTKR